MTDQSIVVRKAFGARVASYRRQAGISQTQLGQRLDPPKTKQLMCNIENGHSRATVEDIIQIHRALRLKGRPGELVNGLLDSEPQKNSPFVG